MKQTKIQNSKFKIQNSVRQALTGGAASAEALRQINPDVAPVYPITPQTPIIEAFAKLAADGKVDTEIITVESEHSAISAAVGSQSAGARTITATSSQGLALMNEILYIASGMRLPITMLISARALSAPINIHGDHSDVMGARDTGWIQLFSENAQEVYDNTIIGTKLAEKSELPIMVIMDGFTTSHSVENLETLPDEAVKKFVGDYHNPKALLNLKKPHTYGPVALPDSYFEFKIDQEEAMNQVLENQRKIYSDFQKLKSETLNSKSETNSKSKNKNLKQAKKDNKCFFERYKTDDAEHIIVLMGSTAGTAKDVVDKLREQGKKVGLLKIKLFRPFPYKEIGEAISKAKNVAVMDRAISFGSVPPLYSEIVNTCNMLHVICNTTSYIYALGGRDIFAKDIEEVFEDMIKSRDIEKVKYLNSNR